MKKLKKGKLTRKLKREITKQGPGNKRPGQILEHHELMDWMDTNSFIINSKFHIPR